MTTALITHEDCLGHEPPPGHPERRARLETILAELDGAGYAALKRYVAPRATLEALARVHEPDYVAAVLEAIPQSGYAQFDPDTYASPGSGEAILRAAGAMLLGVDLVMTGEAANAFCAVRPPGHHARPSQAMGFCFFNNVAAGAAHARAQHGIARLAVVDFDVHHGNGTQEMFFSEPDLFYASTHQSPLYPGTGQNDETGVADNVLNIPLAPGAGGAQFRAAWEGALLPAVRRFAPELILVSAGFDAHRDDPLAQLRFEDGDYFWATERVCALAREICDGRVVSTLEGGYDLDALARSAGAHVRALMAAS